MSITRRTALATGAAAITTAAITAPLAIKAGNVQAALAGDPLITAIDQHLVLYPEAYPDLGQFPEDIWSKIEEESEPIRDRCDDLLCDVFRIPAQRLDGVLAKARLAYRIELGQSTDSRGPVEDMEPPNDGSENNYGALDSPQLIWSLLNDLERLVGGLPS